MTNSTNKQFLVSFFSGVLFAAGLAISGMTQPDKIIRFLTPQIWDPSLSFVMAGAVGLHAFTYHLVRKRKHPILDTKWHIPTRTDITAPLIIGSALFGIGWALVGFCPGPALVTLATGNPSAILFVSAMALGMVFYKKNSLLIKLGKAIRNFILRKQLKLSHRNQG